MEFSLGLDVFCTQAEHFSINAIVSYIQVARFDAKHRVLTTRSRV